MLVYQSTVETAIDGLSIFYRMIFKFSLCSAINTHHHGRLDHGEYQRISIIRIWATKGPPIEHRVRMTSLCYIKSIIHRKVNFLIKRTETLQKSRFVDSFLASVLKPEDHLELAGSCQKRSKDSCCRGVRRTEY